MSHINRSTWRPLLKGESGIIFCKRCDSRLGTVCDGKFSADRGMTYEKNGAVPCWRDTCLDGRGLRVWTKLTEALPMLPHEVAPALTAPPPNAYSDRLQWTIVSDNEGAVVAAICGDEEIPAAA